MAWLYQQRGSRNWWIGYRKNGRQFLKSTGTADRSEAETHLGSLELLEKAQTVGKLTEEFYRTITASELPKVSLRSAIDKWLLACEGTTAPATLARYKSVAKEFLKATQATETKPLLRDISNEGISGFFRQLYKTRASASVNLTRKVLSIFFNDCLAKKLVDSNPVKLTRPVKSNKGEKVQKRAFSIEELDRLHKAAPNDFWRYMVIGGLYTGLRMGDLIQLRGGEINAAERLLRLEMGKVGQAVSIPLAAPFWSILQRRLAELGKTTGYLWPSEARTYQKRGAGPFSQDFYTDILMPCGLVPARINKKRAKNGRNAKRLVNEVSYHSLRHSFISLLRLSGASSAVAKELAGHSSDVVNDLYTHTSVEVMEQAVQRLPLLEV